MGSWMLPGSQPIHDLERAHNTLVRNGGIECEGYSADVNDPGGAPGADGDDDRSVLQAQALPLALHGDVARNLQAHLDWYVCLFRVNQDRDRRDPTERVVRHILMADATYRSLG